MENAESRRLRLHPGCYGVARGEGPGPLRPSVEDGRLRATLEAAGGTTRVLPEEECAPGSGVVKGWRWLEVIGPIDFDETGVLAALAAPLAAAGVSIFALSTFETDHLLVRERDLESAIAALRGAGHAVEEEPGTTRDRSGSQ